MAGRFKQAMEKGGRKWEKKFLRAAKRLGMSFVQYQENLFFVVTLHCESADCNRQA
jgi:hypothetical protein